MSRSADLLTIEALATMALQMTARLQVDAVKNPEHDKPINEARKLMIQAFDLIDTVDQESGYLQSEDKPT